MKRAVPIDPLCITDLVAFFKLYPVLCFGYRSIGTLDRTIRTDKPASDLKPDLAKDTDYIGEVYTEMGKFNLAEKATLCIERIGL